MIIIDKNLLNPLVTLASDSPRLRTMHCFHKSGSDTLQRMINTLNPNSYVQPHKHENPDKREAFIVLRGSLLVVEFNDAGEIIGHVVLNTAAENFGVEIAERVWHTIIALEPGTQVYELKDGPYTQPTDKNFATWAPKENEAGCLEYNNEILRKLNLAAH